MVKSLSSPHAVSQVITNLPETKEPTPTDRYVEIVKDEAFPVDKNNFLLLFQLALAIEDSEVAA